LNAVESLCDTYEAIENQLGLKRVLNLPEILKILVEESSKPGWRNWQTQRTQNPPRATSWGFDSPSRHQDEVFHFVGISG
jgi:hypothetical protein